MNFNGETENAEITTFHTKYSSKKPPSTKPSIPPLPGAPKGSIHPKQILFRVPWIDCCKSCSKECLAVCEWLSGGGKSDCVWFIGKCTGSQTNIQSNRQTNKPNKQASKQTNRFHPRVNKVLIRIVSRRLSHPLETYPWKWGSTVTQCVVWLWLSHLFKKT